MEDQNVTRERRELLLRCAELFYVHKLSKKEVAVELSVSSTHVARLLKQAEKVGLVQIEVRIADRHRTLESALQNKYSLRFARVVDSARTYDLLKQNLGMAAANLLDEFELQRARVKVGIGGGGTLSAMVEELDVRPRALEIFPLALFGRGPQVEFVASTFLATNLLVKTKPLSTAYVVSLPPLPESPQEAIPLTRTLLSLDAVQLILQEAQKADITFLGLGAFTAAEDIFREYERVGYSQDYFTTHRTVGGINYNYFDSMGNQVGDGLITVSIGELSQMASNPRQTVVVVAAGVHKAEALHVVLKHRIVNSVITDESMADNLLKKH